MDLVFLFIKLFLAMDAAFIFAVKLRTSSMKDLTSIYWVIVCAYWTINFIGDLIKCLGIV